MTALIRGNKQWLQANKSAIFVFLLLQEMKLSFFLIAVLLGLIFSTLLVEAKSVKGKRMNDL